MEVKGKYGSAKVFTDTLEDGAEEQIVQLLNQDFLQDSKVRIMPDVHQGMGCVIGFTADMGDKIIPNIVGVDLGCGMLTVELGDRDIDPSKLDRVIKSKVPVGSSVHEKRSVKFDKLEDLFIYRDLKDTKRMERSIGTLGGGNHFIEIGQDSKGSKYMVIHSGSRNLGTQVARHYQDLAVDLCSGKEDYFLKRDMIIESYKEKAKKKHIKKALNDLKRDYEGLKPSYPKDLCYLTGIYRDKYLHDMKICQEYASLNRETMADNILKSIFNRPLEDFSHFETVHNYINFKDNIIRKGAISAYKGEKLLIPINMRDGSILGIGKGNPDWNYSAPHGAGRLLSRTEAKEKLKLEDFKETMKGIYSSSVNMSTLDESPDAYKSIGHILDSLDETVEVIDIIKPIYNFKA